MKKLIYQIISTAVTIDAAGVRALKPLGLTPMTFNILNVLQEGPLSQREISDRVIVAASSMTFQVRRLLKRGLIQRRRSNARTWRVSLTKQGADIRRQAEEHMDRVIAQIPLDPALVAGAESALAGIARALADLGHASFPKVNG